MSYDVSRGALRRRIFLAAEVIVSLALLSVLFSRVDVTALWVSARRASAMWLAIALGIYFVNVLASTWRWRLLLAAQGVEVPSKALLSSYLVAGFFNALNMPITFRDLAVLVPVSFIIQMLPVSLNGYGVREATFAFYFSRLGLPIQSALLVSLMATGLMMLFSLSGAALYVARSR